MLPIVLVLLVAASTLAAPGANLIINNINDVPLPKNNGRPVSAFWTTKAFGIKDDGDSTTYAVTTQPVVHDLANLNDKSSQALALGQAIAILGTQATGLPGDSCRASDFINAYVASLRNGNSVGPALGKFINSINQNIDLIVQLAANPNQAKYAVGPRGNCNGGGRTYQFEAAWDAILSNASGASAGLVNEQYCNAKRLYNSINIQNNNVAAYVTAVSLPPFQAALRAAAEPVAKFIASLPSENARAAAAEAKKALEKAIKY